MTPYGGDSGVGVARGSVSGRPVSHVAEALGGPRRRRVVLWGGLDGAYKDQRLAARGGLATVPEDLRMAIDVVSMGAAKPATRLERLMLWLSLEANMSRIWFAAAAVLFKFGGRSGKRAGIRGLASIGVTSAIVNFLIKPLVKRKRPARDRILAARQLVREPLDLVSSGHAASAFGVIVARARPWRRLSSASTSRSEVRRDRDPAGKGRLTEGHPPFVVDANPGDLRLLASVESVTCAIQLQCVAGGGGRGREAVTRKASGVRVVRSTRREQTVRSAPGPRVGRIDYGRGAGNSGVVASGLVCR